MKQRLVFDTTDATTRLETDNVGAYLRASDGTLLTHTDVSGKKALDVRVAEGINVEVDLSAADDSVSSWLSDGAGNAIGSTGGALHISDAGGSLTVDATALDIRALTQSDEVTVFQGTDPWVIGDGGGSITVDGSLTVNDAALADTAIAAAAETLDAANTAQNIVVSPLANRKYLFVYNKDNQQMYIGQSGVSSTNGFPISPGAYLELRAGPAVDIEFVSAKINHEIRTLELS